MSRLHQPWRRWREQLAGEGIGAKLFRAGSGSFLAGLLAAGMAVLLQIGLTRTLGETQFGQYAYAISWVNLAALLALLGLDTTALRFVAQYRVQGDWAGLRGFLTSSLVATAAAALAMTLALGIGGHWLYPSGESLEAVMGIAALLLPVLVVLKLLGSHLQGLRRVVTSATVQGVLRPALIGAGLLVIGGLGIKLDSGAAMQLNLGATTVTLAVLTVIWSRVLPRELAASPADFRVRQWALTTGPLFLIAGAQALLMTTDTLMLGRMRGTHDSGLYAVAAQLVTVITLGISAANGIVAPMIAELSAKGDRAGLQRLLRLSARGVMGYALPVIIGLALFGRPLLGIYGEAFRGSWEPMMILAMGQLGIVAFGSVGFLLTMSGHERIASATIVGSAAMNIVLNLLFIPRWGATGAASATAIATITRSAVLTLWARRRLGITAMAFSSSTDTRD